MKLLYKFRKSGYSYYVLEDENKLQIVIKGYKNLLKLLEKSI